MPRYPQIGLSMKLTSSKVKFATVELGSKKFFDGHGLYLLVNANGSKYWRLKYRFAGKEKTLAIGVYPEVSLADAREARDEARRLLRSERDPSHIKQLEKKIFFYKNTNSFESVAREWFDLKRHEYSVGHNARTLRILEKDLFPMIGSLPVSDLKTSDLLAALRVVEARTIDIAHRAKQTASKVLRYAVATGRADRDISADLSGALKSRQVKHRATLTDTSEIGQLLRSIDEYQGSYVVKGALQLSPLLFVRPGELRQMTWAELDWRNAIWTIPGEKMKMGSEHIVPLASQSLEVLEELNQIRRKGDYVFPSARGASRPLSDNGVRTALRSMGYDNSQISPHGFRAMARTLLDEKLGYRVDYIEHQLAHAVKDPLGRAYNRTTHLEERRKMMQGWADYLDGLRRGSRSTP